MGLSDYAPDGRKYGCAFCGSERRPCAFHQGDVARIRARRNWAALVFVTVLASVLLLAVVEGWFA